MACSIFITVITTLNCRVLITRVGKNHDFLKKIKKIKITLIFLILLIFLIFLIFFDYKSTFYNQKKSKKS